MFNSDQIKENKMNIFIVMKGLLFKKKSRWGIRSTKYFTQLQWSYFSKIMLQNPQYNKLSPHVIIIQRKKCHIQICPLQHNSLFVVKFDTVFRDGLVLPEAAYQRWIAPIRREVMEEWDTLHTFVSGGENFTIYKKIYGGEGGQAKEVQH